MDGIELWEHIVSCGDMNKFSFPGPVLPLIRCNNGGKKGISAALAVGNIFKKRIEDKIQRHR